MWCRALDHTFARNSFYFAVLGCRGNSPVVELIKWRHLEQECAANPLVREPFEPHEWVLWYAYHSDSWKMRHFMSVVREAYRHVKRKEVVR